MPLALLTLLAVAAVLYAPWEWRPVGLGDVAEYLPLLRRGGSTLERFWLLTELYATKYGRFNPTVFLLTSAKWTLFGSDPFAWYWLRFAVMSGNVLLTFALLRRLGATRAGAFFGAALFVISTPASWTWVALSIGEPIAVLFLLVALHLAAGYRAAARWPWRAAAIGALALLALLAKEMTACVLPLVVLLGACHAGAGELAPPRVDRRTVWLVLCCVAATATAAAGVLWAASAPSANNFGSAYAVTSVSLDALEARLFSALMPVFPTDRSEKGAALFVALTMMLVLLFGARAALRPRGTRRQALAWLGLALATPVAGALLYVPWPTWADIYAVPMLIGQAMLLAFALTWLARANARHSLVAAGTLALALVVSTTFAWRRAEKTAATFRTYDAMLSALAHTAPVDEIVLLTPKKVSMLWPTDDELARLYVHGVYGVTLPPTRTAPCRALREPRHARTVFVSSSVSCGSLPRRTAVWHERFRYVDWSRLAVATDSAHVEARFDTANVAADAP